MTTTQGPDGLDVDYSAAEASEWGRIERAVYNLRGERELQFILLGLADHDHTAFDGQLAWDTDEGRRRWTQAEFDALDELEREGLVTDIDVTPLGAAVAETLREMAGVA